MSTNPPPQYTTSGSPERPDDDDYDLLTYGEAAVRIAQLLREERVALTALEGTNPPDVAALAKQRERIALLERSNDHYRNQQQTADAFMQRFGLVPRPRP